MMPPDFYRAIRDAEIACTQYPVLGAHILFPLGMEIVRNLENYVGADLKESGYMEISLPGVVPESFVSHLRLEELFRAENKFHNFYLSQGSEAQAAHVARELIRSPRDFPLRFFSRNNVYRQNNRVPLIKDIELRLSEYHGFFIDGFAAQEEKERLGRAFQKRLTDLSIPSLIVHKQPDVSSALYIYAYFSFLETFGALFSGSNLDTEFTDSISMRYLKHGAKTFEVSHIDMSYTNRLLPAYLSNNMDSAGFILTKDITPYYIYLNSNGLNPAQLEVIKTMLKAEKLSWIEKDIPNPNEARKRYLLSGIPLFIGAGKRQLKLLSRSGRDVIWADMSEVSDIAKRLLAEYTSLQANVPSRLNMQEITKPLAPEQYDSRTVYLVCPDEDKSFIPYLKSIGFVDSGHRAMVKRKY